MKTDAETIAAIATPPGRGAIGVIRISGPAVRKIEKSLFLPDSGDSSPVARPRYMCLRWIQGRNSVLDQVTACFYPGPHSYTGEDLLEIFTHGGPGLMAAVLARIMELGARPAQPGEFTRRAVLNGKMDLAQAEAISWMIGVSSEEEAALAARQLGGELGGRLREIHRKAVGLQAAVEVTLDFDEYEGIDAPSPQLLSGLSEIGTRLEEIRKAAVNGEKIRNGLRVVILGSPNTGKSSILNRLLGWDRAIVSNLPGTTRDILEADLVVSGVRLCLVDTAGIRLTPDEIETEGIRRASLQVREADLVLVVLDGSTSLSPNDLEVCRLARAVRVLVLLNKEDQGCLLQLNELKIYFPEATIMTLSTKVGEGIERLKQKLGEFVQEQAGLNGSAIMVGCRRLAEVEAARAALTRASQALREPKPRDQLAQELRELTEILASLAGEVKPDDLLDEIFSGFCVGK